MTERCRHVARTSREKAGIVVLIRTNLRGFCRENGTAIEIKNLDLNHC
ncbi:MAG: hypothetical protein HC910_20335 [Spirulinaceae cyanobacterium SM2_1_0]|nr:hypothetical protein [Spirulinaceae cyanobacterium SM2_1_0]